MNGNFIDKNLDALKKSDPFLAGRISEAVSEGISVVVNSAGDAVPQLLSNGRPLFIHSKYDPRKEASRFIGELPGFDFDLFVVFGFGFGYHIEELLTRVGMDATILVIQKDAAVLRSAFESRDLSQILSDNRLRILLDPTDDDVSECMRGRSSYRITFVTHRGSLQSDPEYYSNISRVVKSYLSTKEVNIATLAKFEKLWNSNIARNIDKFIELPAALNFYGKFRGIPAIVVAAGPTLTMSLDFIKKNRDKAIIVAVDTAYKILQRNGIEPHFCICVDPQVINARYFEGVKESRSVLVSDPTVHPSVFRLFKGRAVMTGMSLPVMKWVESYTGEKGEITNGGSVSTNAYDFAKRLGASPVTIVGQDLAFTGGYAHAKGSYLDEQVHLKSFKFLNETTFNRRQLYSLPKIEVRGIRSPRVHTNQKLMIFLNWFEKRKDSDFVNLTYDGAAMSGVNHSDADTFHFNDLDCSIDHMIDGILNSAPESLKIKSDVCRKTSVIKNEMESLADRLERAVKLSQELCTLIGTKKSGEKRRVGEILESLSQVDAYVNSKSGLTDMVGITVQRVIHTITEGYELAEGESGEDAIAKRSLFLYKGLLEGSLFNIKLLKKMEVILSR